MRALLFAAFVGMVGHAFAEDASTPAAKDGWVERAFEFSAPDLDFTALVPEGAKVETVPMKAREDGTLGYIKIIGEISAIETAEVPIRVTIVAFDLKTAGGAERICSRLHSEIGYKLADRQVSDHGSDALYLSLKREDDVPVAGIISRCTTRGRQAISANFFFDMPKAISDSGQDAIIQAADDYARTFGRSMSFKNGEDGGYWDGVKDVAIKMDGKTFDIRVPDDWEVPINDFDGRSTGELHILKYEDGLTKGAVWLLAWDMADKPDLEQVGSKLLSFFIKLQFRPNKAPKLKSTEAGRDINGKGSLVQHFVFSLKNRDDDELSDVRAVMVWNEGRAYTLMRWSTFADDGSRNAFFTNLPLLTIHDALVKAMDAVLADDR